MSLFSQYILHTAISTRHAVSVTSRFKVFYGSAPLEVKECGERLALGRWGVRSVEAGPGAIDLDTRGAIGLRAPPPSLTRYSRYRCINYSRHGTVSVNTVLFCFPFF